MTFKPITLNPIAIFIRWRTNRRYELHAERRRKMRLDYARKPRTFAPMAQYRNCDGTIDRD